jgi:hypothetical protein
MTDRTAVEAGPAMDIREASDRFSPPEGEDGYRRPGEEHPVISGSRARQAVKVGAMRYVLGVSLALAVVVIAVAYFLVVVFHR